MSAPRVDTPEGFERARRLANDIADQHFDDLPVGIVMAALALLAGQCLKHYPPIRGFEAGVRHFFRLVEWAAREDEPQIIPPLDEPEPPTQARH